MSDKYASVAHLTTVPVPHACRLFLDDGRLFLDGECSIEKYYVCNFFLCVCDLPKKAELISADVQYVNAT